MVLCSTALLTVAGQFVLVNLVLYGFSALIGIYYHAEPASVDLVMRYIQGGYYPVEGYNFELVEEPVSPFYEVQSELRLRVEHAVVQLDDSASNFRKYYRAKIEFLQDLLKKTKDSVSSQESYYSSTSDDYDCTEYVIYF